VAGCEFFEEYLGTGERKLPVIELTGDGGSCFRRPCFQLLEQLAVILGQTDELPAPGEILLVDPQTGDKLARTSQMSRAHDPAGPLSS
jgi:hypothetical protein